MALGIMGTPRDGAETGGSMRMRITQLLNSIPVSHRLICCPVSFSCAATKTSAVMFSGCIVASGSVYSSVRLS